MSSFVQVYRLLLVDSLKGQARLMDLDSLQDLDRLIDLEGLDRLMDLGPLEGLVAPDCLLDRAVLVLLEALGGQPEQVLDPVEAV